MKHFLIDANPELIPFFEDLYEKQFYDFTLQYGDAPHFLLSSNQESFYPIALSQKGARELTHSEITDAFLDLHGSFWMGNPDYVEPEI